MRILSNLPLLAILVFISCGNNSSNGSGNDLETSVWPKDAQDRTLDSTLVITNLTNDELDRFQPIIRSDLTKLEPSFRDAELGKTLNSATKNIQGNLVKYNFTKKELNIKSLGHVRYEFKSIKDFYDLVKKFNLDISTSVKYFSFRGNAKYELAKSLKINKYHEYIAARIYVEDREEALKEIFIRPEAAELAKTDKKKFVSKFGDQVITSKIIGGDLIAVIEIESSNSTEQDSNRSHIDAAFKAWGAKAKVDANMQSALEQIRNTSKYNIRLIHNGIIIDSTESYTDINTLKNLIDKFPQLIHNRGKVLEYKTSSIFSAVQDLPFNLNAEDFLKIELQSYQLGTLENNINSLYNTLPNLEYVIENPELFSKGAVDSAKIIYNRNFQAARAYEHNWKICATVPELCNRTMLFQYKAPSFVPLPTPDKKNADNSNALNIGIKRENLKFGGFHPLVSIPNNQEYIFKFNGKVAFNRTDHCYEPFVSRLNNENSYPLPGGPSYPVIELKLTDDNGTKYEILKQSDKTKIINATHGNITVEYGLFCYFVNLSSTNRQCYPFRDCEGVEIEILRQK